MRKNAFNRISALGLSALSILWIQAAVAGEAEAKTTIYFTRHGEDMVTSECWGDPDDPCCVEILNPVGELRAQLLADWFASRNITKKLTHILTTNKVRTRQTLRHIAADALAQGVMLAEDYDANPGDGIQQVPAFDENGDPIEECTPGHESSKSTRQPMLDAIMDIHAQGESNVILAAGHSPQLYWIIRALGIDTGDDIVFPKTCKGEDHDPPCDNIDKNERVSGFNNIWVVVIDEEGKATLKQHYVFSFELSAVSEK